MPIAPKMTIKPNKTAPQPQWVFWGIWIGVMVIACAALPFIARQSELVLSFAQFCAGAVTALM